MRPWLLILLPTLCGCQAPVDPELACQQRIVAARGGGSPETDPFAAAAYRAVERSGCSPRQLAALDRLAALAAALPTLTKENERQAGLHRGNAQMEPFQRMNDALIELNELEQAQSTELARMGSPR